MKTKYRTLKGKYDEMKTKGSGNGDNSEFTKIVASILAVEGAVKQHKLYIKEHAIKNNIPVEGFGLDGDEGREEVEEETPKIEETPEEENEIKEQPLPGSEPESESESGSGSSSGAVSESESGSGSGSESEEESAGVPPPLEPVSVNSNESLPVSSGAEGEDGSVAPAAAPGPAAPASAPAAPGQISGEISKILGGRSHFVKKSHIKTHRHHNRRNRHKTLKNKA